jgi:LysR family hydrogen peroxide-inducible transcriptional activator
MPSFKKKTITTNELKDHHPWLLSSGNCLRSQMIRFCQLKEEADETNWNYEGGNIDLLMTMTDQLGGYTLVPEFHHVKESNTKDIKRIVSSDGKHYPAREIIALSPNRSLKWEILEKLFREVQLKYGKPFDEGLEILDWK